MKIKIEVMLRDAILDPQGNTIKKSLNSLGFKNVKSVRQGKLIEIDLNTSSSNKEKRNGSFITPVPGSCLPGLSASCI